MMHHEISSVEKTVTDVFGILTASIGLMGLSQALIGVSFFESSLPLVRGTFLSLTVIGFGVILTTHGATRAFRQLRKTIVDIRS